MDSVKGPPQTGSAPPAAGVALGSATSLLRAGDGSQNRRTIIAEPRDLILRCLLRDDFQKAVILPRRLRQAGASDAPASRNMWRANAP